MYIGLRCIRIHFVCLRQLRIVTLRACDDFTAIWFLHFRYREPVLNIDQNERGEWIYYEIYWSQMLT